MRSAQNLAGLMLFLMLTHGGGAFAQTRLFTSYTKADGLPSDYVLRIYQAPSGYLWFGTERGAARYDGERFTTFTNEDGLPHNMVYDVLEDAQSRTWFATPSPILAYLKNGSIHVYRDSAGSQTPINSIAMDRNNRVYFRFHDGMGVLNGDSYQFHAVSMQVSKESRMIRLLDGRLLMSDGDYMLVTRLDSGTDFRLDTLLTLDRHNNFIAFDQGPDSTVYITSPFGVTRYRLLSDRLEAMEFTKTGFNTTISALPNNRVVLGSRYTGLSLLDNGTVTPLLTSAGSERNFVSSQMLDYEGNLWIGLFGQGLEKITTWNTLVFNEENGLEERNVWRVTTHRGDPIAMSVGGIQRIRDGKVGSIDGMPAYSHHARGLVFTDDRVYIGRFSDVLIHEYDPRKDRIGAFLGRHDAGDGVNDIALGSDGSLWIATAGLVLTRITPDGRRVEFPMKNGSEKLVRTGDAMWILTSTDGAFRFENEEFRHFTKTSGDLRSNAVSSAFEDENGILIGTAAGFTSITPDGNRTQYDVSPVIGIFPTNTTGYWIVTPIQLHHFEKGTLTKRNSLATLSSVMAGTHWVYPSDDLTKMYLGSTSGLVIYDLTAAGRELPPPKVAIRGVTIQSTRYPAWMDGEIRHRASSSTLEFEFSGLSFVKENETTFSYRLVGVDKDWSSPQTNRVVRYANVAPGTYEFQVRAINTDGVASTDVATLSLRLDPPWWMHPVVLFILILLAVFALYWGLRWRLRVIRADIIKRNEQKQFEAIQRIGASISHDIKNTVFSLSLLSKNLEKRFDNPEFRKDAIDTIESSLTYLSTLVNRLQETPAQGDANLSDVSVHAICANVVKRVLGGSDRHVDIDIPDTMRMTVNPEPVERILENLIRNALEATTSEQHVRVSAQQIGTETEIFVIDDGQGMSSDFIQHRLFKPFQSTKTKGLGIGLYACKELADAIGATIQVESEPGKGTTFRLRFFTSPP